MNEKPLKMTVTCYHCKKTFDCEFLERSAFIECPVCEGGSWVRALYSENTKLYWHEAQKLKLR
ncbi:hypothetical protein [Methanomethylovorans sp.]|uniref:hypothetical protein n=1 Tax=Methanomethylovorans sp. TaxID=2758717 RepID=UPI00345EF5D6